MQLYGLPNECTDQTEKATLGFHIKKIWQILKRFAGTFHRAQTLKLQLGGVTISRNSILNFR